jgi:hypothetical protein
MEKLERKLAQGIQHHHQCAISLPTMITWAKAKGKFENLSTDPDPKVQSFAAIAGWFQYF